MQFEFCFYQRQFRQPLRTNHGLWSVREGIIVRLKDEAGRIGYGEIAPIETFGTESIEQVIAFCRQLPREITAQAIAEIPDTLPSCQFGFESALTLVQQESSLRCAGLQPPKSHRMGDFELYNLAQSPPLVMSHCVGRVSRLKASDVGDLGGFPSHQTKQITAIELKSDLETPRRINQALPHSVLLPTGETALQAWKTFWEQGYRTFKLKIGVNSIQEEIAILEKLLTKIPNQAVLRLDANGGLTESEAQQWLAFCEGSNIEFLEQPLSVEAFDSMLKLSERYTTSIALDESVTTTTQLQDCYDRGWRGIFVVKPAIAGFPSRLRQFCQTHAIDTVFSSVFETAIARQFGLNLAAELSNRAVGYGTSHWFNELMMDDFDAVWNSL